MRAVPLRRVATASLYFIAPFVVLIAVWQLVCQLGVVTPTMLASPLEVATSLLDLLHTRSFFESGGVTLLALGISFGLSVVIGVLAGVLMGWYRPVEYALDPFVWFLYAAPVVALFPLFVVTLGLGTGTVVAISFLMTVSPIVSNTAAGVKQVDPVLVRAAQVFGAKGPRILFQVALPAAAPMIIAGLRVGIGRAITGVVVGEMFAASQGLGYDLSYFTEIFQTSNGLAIVIVIAVLGLAANALLGLLEKRLLRWRG